MASAPLFTTAFAGDLPAFERERGGERQWTAETWEPVARMSRASSDALSDVEALREASLLGLGRSAPALDSRHVLVPIGEARAGGGGGARGRRRRARDDDAAHRFLAPASPHTHPPTHHPSPLLTPSFQEGGGGSRVVDLRRKMDRETQRQILQPMLAEGERDNQRLLESVHARLAK